jgi:prophage regulatory protein
MTKLISKKITADRVSLHPASLMRKVREGVFPRPVHVGLSRIAFVESEVDAWIADRVAERDAALKNSSNPDPRTKSRVSNVIHPDDSSAEAPRHP